MSSCRGPPRVRVTRRQARRLVPAVAAALWLAAGAAAADEHAIDRLTRGLAAAEAQDGKTSPYLLPVIEELAQAQLRDGALREAAGLRRRALDIAIGAFGCDAASAGEAMAALAVIAIDRRRYLDGEPLLVIAEALAADRKHHGAEGAEGARSLAALAGLALRRGRAAEALPLIEEAMAIDQARLGRSHPFIADDFYDLGLAYAALERGDDAQ